MINSIYQPKIIFNFFLSLNLQKLFSPTVLKHFFTILTTALTLSYRGKTVQFEKFSPCHRTTVAHFLNKGKWDDKKLEQMIKSIVLELIYRQSRLSQKPVYCIVDDTILSKSKPSSQAFHPIEDAYFHHSHLKRKQDYGHQAVAVLLSCNGFILNYCIQMYDKEKSKIQLVKEVAMELEFAPVPSYFLCDSWYTSSELIDVFQVKGFYTVGALKTNRIIFPCGIRQQVSEFAQYIEKTDKDVHLVTVGSRQYYVYRYEGNLNQTENVVVLISYPKEGFHQPKALRAFLCADASLSTEEILGHYVNRWPIEIFFRECKNKLAMDQYQIRSTQGIKRYWLFMSLTHLMCCTQGGKNSSFTEGYASCQKEIQDERLTYIYQCGVKHVPLEDVLKMVG